VSVVLFLDAVAHGGDCWEFFHVEESGATQVFVAVGDSRVDAGDANGRVDGRFRDVGFVVNDCKVKVGELSSDFGRAPRMGIAKPMVDWLWSTFISGGVAGFS
jgi:hypothetical protein